MHQEEYEDYMREKREVDKQKQHLLDSGLSAAFPDEHTSDSGPMPLVSPTTSSEDLQRTLTPSINLENNTNFSERQV